MSDISNLENLRRVLGDLHEKRVSSDQVIEVCRKHIEQQSSSGKTSYNFSINRNQLDRFRRGENIRRINELQLVWDAIHGPFGFNLLLRSNRVVGQASSEVVRSADNFLRELGSTSGFGPLAEQLAGRYRMYRPGWKAGRRRDTMMTSLIEIAVLEGYLNVRETQNFIKATSFGIYHQTDEGFMFKFGSYSYFLMKEVKGGTTVKFGIVETMFPISDSQPIDYFYGKLSVASHIRIYPDVPYYCHRIEDDGEFESFQLTAAEIEDEDIRRHLEL